jgi:hypothetical protein
MGLISPYADSQAHLKYHLLWTESFRHIIHGGFRSILKRKGQIRCSARLDG